MSLEYTSGCLTFSSGVSEGLIEKVITIIHSIKNNFPDFINIINGILKST